MPSTRPKMLENRKSAFYAKRYGKIDCRGFLFRQIFDTLFAVLKRIVLIAPEALVRVIPIQGSSIVYLRRAIPEIRFGGAKFFFLENDETKDEWELFCSAIILQREKLIYRDALLNERIGIGCLSEFRGGPNLIVPTISAVRQCVRRSSRFCTWIRHN